MRKIKIVEWDEANPSGEKNKVSLLTYLEILFRNIPPAQAPKGLDKIRTFGRIAKAFEVAKKSKTLVLDEADYSYIKKDLIDKHMSASWRMIKELGPELDKFLEAETEKEPDKKPEKEPEKK